MKHIAIILFTFLFFQVEAQTYIPMPFENGMMWRTDFETASKHFKISETILGDTIIGVQTYKKIFHFSTQFGTGPFWTAIGRYDTIDKRVYLGYGLNESILYDFSLQVGDTIRGYHIDLLLAPGVDTVKVDFMDSILLNGVYHRRFNSTPIQIPLTGGPIRYTYIDGIGSPLGFKDICFAFECNSSLECVGKTFNQSLYPDSLYHCIYATPTKDITLKNAILVYPNPVSEEIRIHSTESVYEIEIRDMMGRVIFHDAAYYDNEPISIGHYIPGVYVVQVKTAKGTITRKISKE